MYIYLSAFLFSLIFHYYLDNFPMAWMFKNSKLPHNTFLTTGNSLQKKQISAHSALPNHKQCFFANNFL